LCRGPSPGLVKLGDRHSPSAELSPDPSFALGVRAASLSFYRFTETDRKSFMKIESNSTLQINEKPAEPGAHKRRAARFFVQRGERIRHRIQFAVGLCLGLALLALVLE
jgi:hypothetical protein